MSVAQIVFRISGETGAFTSFTLPIEAGTPTATPIAFDVWNTPDDGSGETARDVRLHVAERRPGETEWTQERELTGNAWLEMRVTGTLGEAPAYTTGWTPVGRSRPFRLQPIPGDSAISVELRANVPGSAADDVLEIYLRATFEAPSTPVALGPHYAGLRGISSGIGDGARSFLVEVGAITATGTPDDEIHLGDLVWIGAGRRYVKLAHDLVLDGDAADGPLASGEAYYATLYVNAVGALVVLKSNAGTAPLAVGDRLPPPNGEPVVAYVHREEDDTIEQADIFEVGMPGSFRIHGGTGLTLTMGPGVALVDDRLIEFDFEESVTFPASETGIEVYLLPSGQKVATVDGRPDPRALLLYKAETDSTDVTELVDVRPFLRTQPGVLSFRFDAGPLAVDDFSFRTLGADADAVLQYPVACLLILDDLGTGTSSGATTVDVEQWDGAAWVTLFTSFATVDRRPSVAYNASALSGVGVPEVSRIPKGTRLRARVKAVPSGGTAPSGAEVLLFFEVPGDGQ